MLDGINLALHNGRIVAGNDLGGPSIHSNCSAVALCLGSDTGHQDSAMYEGRGVHLQIAMCQQICAALQQTQEPSPHHRGEWLS